MDLTDLVAATAEAGFVTDLTGRIVGWNPSAEVLLGYPAAKMLGKCCYETLRGLDLFGNRYCDAECPVRNMVRRREPLCRTKVCFRNADNHAVPVWLWPVVVSGERSDDPFVLHLLHPIAGSNEDRHAGSEPGAGSPATDAGSNFGQPDRYVPAEQLTPRELEVLRLLTEGHGTAAIAERLYICKTTVRNHVHHMLHKLEVGSRAEAIALALRSQIV